MSASPELKDCTLAVEGRVATLTFGRDDVRNALTGTAIAADIEDTVAWANANPAISVLVVTGAGSAFSAGGNVKVMGSGARNSAHELQRDYSHGVQRIPRALETAEVPVIAAINGAAIGAGFDLANMCDIRIAAAGAQFGETFLNLGIIPGDGGAWFLSRLTGYQRAAELLFTGRIMKADEALALGLVLEVVPPAELLPRTHEIASRIAAQPPVALRYAKRLLKLAQKQNLEEHLELCAAFQGLCQKTADHDEALRAFFEKRPGRYTGT